MDAVRLTDLHKSFGDVTAVDGVDLTIRPGEVVALLGPNGAGKTTTIDMILGLSRPTSGDARVFGMSPRQAVDRGLVAAVMQTAGLLPDITVRETVQLTASLFSHRIDAEEAMHRAGVTDFASRIVKKCSGGQQQRLRFAMALVSDPALLILDEPTTGMDSVSGRSLRATLTCTPEQLHSALTDLQTRGQIHDIEILGNTLTLSSTDSDAVAALLLSEHLAQDLEITSRGLEDAFMALTSGSASAPSTGASA